jgi:4-amino-4-deoxy-L-arabinose transferase-like glycosyltransferase
MLLQKNTNRWWYILVAVSCLHLFFINIKDSHDWGDDFAQYIHQAENITKGISQNETGYIYNMEYPLYSPPAYFMGFPLLLASVYAIAGNDIITFSLLISIFLFLSALLFFRFFKEHFNSVSSYLLVLIIVYNPWMIDYKMEIGSDIPFTLFLFLSTLFYLTSKRNYKSIIISGILAGFVVSVRSIGISFVIAVMINELLSFKREKTKNRKLFFQRGVVFLLTSVGFFILLNNVIFDIPLLNFKSSSSLFSYDDLYNTVLKNINYYFDLFQSFFNTNEENRYIFFSTLMKSLMLSFLLLGFYLRMKRGIEFIDILLIAYMLVLYAYPYSSAGFRFLIPVTPILLLYAVEGLYFLTETLQWKKTILYCLCIISFFAVYKFEWNSILDNQNKVEQGPQRMDSKAAFDFISNNTGKNARILFKKPRALALYTGRNCFVNNPDSPFEKLNEQIKEYNINYILINDEISDQAIKSFISQEHERVNLVWNNSAFRLFKVLK